MDDDLDRDLLRLLSGELDPERASRLERAIDADAALRRRWEEWRGLWRGLELPAPEPTDLLPAIRRRLAEDRAVAGVGAAVGSGVGAGELWRGAPAWGRALAAAALAVGVGLGVWLGEITLTPDDSLWIGVYEPSLAESYWTEAPWTEDEWMGDRWKGEESMEVESSDGDVGDER